MTRATISGVLGLAALAVAGVALSTRGATSEGGERVRGAPPPDLAADRGGPLDGLPEYAIPFKDYKAPDRVFFTKPTEYRGPGRDDAEFEGEKEVRLGLLAPLDGPAKAYGIEMQRGATLAVDEANAKGGVRGLPVRLIAKDDQGLQGEAANGAIGLIEDDRVLAILGTVHSANTHVLFRVALKTETPVLTSVSTDPTLTQHSIPWGFRCLVDDQPQGRALAKYLFEKKRYTKICTMWFNNKYGRMGILEIRNIAKRLQHPVLYDLSFNAGDTDFTDQLSKVKESGAEALVLWGLYREIAGVVKQARAMGIAAELVGGDGFVSQAFLDMAGPAAEGVVATYPYDVGSSDAVNRRFVEAFTKAYGHEPDSFGAHGYDAMNLLLSAVEKGGLNRARIRDALALTTDVHGVTGRITLDNVGTDKRIPPLARVVNGKFTLIED